MLSPDTAIIDRPVGRGIRPIGPVVSSGSVLALARVRGLGLQNPGTDAQIGAMSPEAYLFADDGRFPNSPLPLLVYRAALPLNADDIEARFANNGWSNAWRNGIYAYHHFHSTAHEVLGIAADWAEVQFGGPNGRAVKVQAGDVVVIPADVAHRNMNQSADLLVVGAYPGGMDCDMCRDGADHAKTIAAVPVPDCNPVTGRKFPNAWDFS
jgi:uncharacterized protein YjlB